MSLRLAASIGAMVALFTITTGQVLGQAEPLAAAPAQRPNFVLLVLDDQDAFTPFWDAMPRTRQLVPARGLIFTNAFSTTPICTPGRATILSGRQAHHTHVYTLVGPTGGWNFASQLGSTFAVALSQLGYTNALFGKTWGSTVPDPGWRVWCALGGDHMYEGYNYEVTEKALDGSYSNYIGGEYSTDFLADKAIGFLRARAGSSLPFFLYLAPTAPHLPLSPAPRHQAIAYQRWNGRLPHRADYNERNISDKSQWLKSTAAIRSAAVPYADGEYYKRMGSLMAVDEMMGRVHQELVRQGVWDNTIVIVTSDNGYNLGAHRLIHKMAPYEESIKVPLAVAGPGVVVDESNALVGLHDLAPTFIDLAGGTLHWPMDGQSLAPFLLEGAQADVNWRTSLIIEYNTGGVFPGYNPGGAMRRGYSLDIPTYRGLRTSDHKYIRWGATGEEEIYDLTSDPLELNNLVKTATPEVQQLRKAFRAQLRSVLP
jgi:arylsulfatase A-like enzyme